MGQGGSARACWSDLRASLFLSLSSYPGSDVSLDSLQHQIYLRAKTTEILTLGEIMLVLETLEANGVVERKAVEEEEAPLGWDDARWFLKWKWYGA